MALLQRRCYVFRKPVFSVRTYHGALQRTLQGIQCPVADVTVVRAFPPAHPRFSCSRTALNSPALLRSVGAGRRDIRTWARKKAADVAASAEDPGSTTLLDHAAAEEVKPAKKAGRKKKGDTAAAAAAAEQGDVALQAASDVSITEAAQSSDVGNRAATDEPKPVKRRTRKKKEAATAAPQHHEDIPSQHTVSVDIDLHANAPKSAHWQRVDSWVVFSDLHVGLRTVDVACQVLQRVREEAAARNAGILFLGMLLSELHKDCRRCTKAVIPESAGTQSAKQGMKAVSRKRR